MVDLIDAYRIVNKSVLQVADDLVELDVLEFEDKPNQVRLEETPFSIAERHERLNGLVVVGHNLTEYTNKFYSISLVGSDYAWIDYLIDAKTETIDLTEFGEFI